MIKSKYRLLLLILMAVVLLIVPTFAAESSSLTVITEDGTTPLSNAEFAIYHFASLDEDVFILTDDFASSRIAVNTDENDWNAIVSTLEGYIAANHPTPTDRGRTAHDGMVRFPTGSTPLDAGLYLVVGQPHVQNKTIYEFYPTIVRIDPGKNIQIRPKMESFPDLDPGPDESAETVTRKVLKVWNDAGISHLRPEEVVVHLLRNGEIYSTVTLSQENNWRHTWTKLDKNSKWNVVEVVPNGYTVTVERKGVTFVVTNTRKPTVPPVPDTPDPPDPDVPLTPPTETPSSPGRPVLPQTGQLWWPVPLLVIAGLVFVVLGLLRRRGSAHEV